MKGLRGSMTVESAYVMPIVFGTFLMIIYITFYFHDKNIIKGCLYETAAIIAQRERIDDTEENRTAYFEERLGNKLILLSGVSFDAISEDNDVKLTATARKEAMEVSLSDVTTVIKPEQYIRKIRNIEKTIQEKQP